MYRFWSYPHSTKNVSKVFSVQYFLIFTKEQLLIVKKAVTICFPLSRSWWNGNRWENAVTHFCHYCINVNVQSLWVNEEMHILSKTSCSRGKSIKFTRGWSFSCILMNNERCIHHEWLVTRENVRHYW